MKNLRRRDLLAAGAALATFPRASMAQGAMVRIIATGLKAPESPKPLPDGSVLVVEMARGTLSRVTPDGLVHVVANLGGTPNGVAPGPDGTAYVCNSGGLIFKPAGDLMVFSGNNPDAVGLIQRVDLKTGAFSTLYSEAGGIKLQGPNDIVFDPRGGFWFTAARMPHPNGTDRGAVFFATVDGNNIRRVAWLAGSNGIGLSPDNKTLYVIGSGHLWGFTVENAGRLAAGANGEPEPRMLYDAAGQYGFDSMAVDSAGNAVIGALGRGDVATLPREGQLITISPEGKLLESAAMPDRFVTNVGFGGKGLKTAYVSLTTTGRLAAISWPRPGLKLAY